MCKQQHDYPIVEIREHSPLKIAFPCKFPSWKSPGEAEFLSLWGNHNMQHPLHNIFRRINQFTAFQKFPAAFCQSNELHTSESDCISCSQLTFLPSLLPRCLTGMSYSSYFPQGPPTIPTDSTVAIKMDCHRP